MDKAACYAANVEAIAPWLTPALVIALGAWLRADLRDLRRDVSKRFDDVSRDIADLRTDIADLRERMAKLEGALEGFLAGRRDRDAA